VSVIYLLASAVLKVPKKSFDLVVFASRYIFFFVVQNYCKATSLFDAFGFGTNLPIHALMHLTI